MRSNSLRFGWLIGLVLLGTGASSNGVGQAEQWHHEAEIAKVFGQWATVYERSFQGARVFPRTPHGRNAEGLAQEARDQMVTPARSPASEDWTSQKEEIRDFFVWP